MFIQINSIIWRKSYCYLQVAWFHLLFTPNIPPRPVISFQKMLCFFTSNNYPGFARQFLFSCNNYRATHPWGNLPSGLLRSCLCYLTRQKQLLVFHLKYRSFKNLLGEGGNWEQIYSYVCI